MRIHLTGDETKTIDLPGGATSVQFNRELTPDALSEAASCVFDRLRADDLQQRLPDLQRRFEASARSAVLILPLSGNTWLDTVSDLPGRLVSLIPRLADAGAIAVPSDRLRAILPFQDTDDPLEDALIRLFDGERDARLELSDVMLDGNGATWPFPELSPGMTPCASPAIQQHLARFVPEELGPVQSAEDAVALIAGLFQMHDCLERSHALSQDVEGEGRHAAGDYWHAVMHRREPDYGNSKYWYRRVGRHPIFQELALRAAREFESAGERDSAAWSERVCGGGEWNAFAWVDLCEAAGGDRSGPLRDVARRIQWHEMLLLLRQTAQDTYGLG